MTALYREEPCGSVGAHEVAELHARLLAHRARRTAVVVADDTEFGLARMFQTLVEFEGADAGACRDEAEVLEWLGQVEEGGARP